MAYLRTVLGAGIVLVGLAGCGSDAERLFLKPPDLMEQLANADLSASPPLARQRGGNSVQRVAAEQSYRYPGEDQVARPRAKRDGVSQNGNGYELHFSDAALPDLVKVILRDTLSIPYVYDPRVQGRVTLSTGGSVTRKELLDILEGVLAVNRAHMLADGNTYRIVPDAGGQQDPALSFDYHKEREEIGAVSTLAGLPHRRADAVGLRQRHRELTRQRAVGAALTICPRYQQLASFEGRKRRVACGAPGSQIRQAIFEISVAGQAVIRDSHHFTAKRRSSAGLAKSV